MSVPPRGSVVIADGRGRVTVVPPSQANTVFISDPNVPNKVRFSSTASVVYPILNPSERISIIQNNTTGKLDIDVVTGSTANTVAAGNDGRLDIPNIIMVKNGSPGPGEFVSIIDAINSITDNTVNYLVKVGPGTYTENATITIPPNVYVEGFNTKASIVKPSGNFDLFSIQSATGGISNLTITGVDPTKWAIHCYNANNTVVRDLLILSCAQGILVEEAIDTDSYLFFTTCTIRGSGLNTGIRVLNTQANRLEAVVNNLNFYGTIDNLFVANGPNTSFGAKNINAYGTNTGNFLAIENGADCNIVGSRISGWNNAFITIDGVTNAPSLIVSGCSVDSNTTDINITNPTTTGYYNGYAPFLKSTIHSASSFFITGKDKKIIAVAKKGGDFTSINAALNAITDATSSNPYIISVGPGIFVESPIVLKSYVALIGSGNAATVIVCNVPTGRAITGADATELRYCQISCLSANAGIAVYYAGTGLNLPFAVNNCTFGNAQTLVQVNTIQYVATMVANNCFVGGTFDSQIGFQVLSSNSIPASLVLLNCLLQDLVTPFPSTIAMASGNSAVLTITNSIIRLGTPNTSTGIVLQDGAVGRISNISLKNLDVGILVKNTGAAPRLDASTVQFLDCRTNISVDHPDTTGQYVGAVDTTRVFINKTASFSIRDRSINTFIVDKKGFDYTSVAAAIAAINPMVQMVITDGSVNITSASLFNIEMDSLAVIGPGIPDNTYAVYIDQNNMILTNPATQTNTITAQFIRATPLNTFVVFIETGQFIEPAFTVPSFVSLMGRDNNQAILYPLDPTSRFVELNAYTSISNLTISNVADVALSINSVKFDPITPMVQVHDCIFYNCGTAIKTTAEEFVCSYFFNNLLFLGITNIGIDIDASAITPGLDTVKINMNGIFMEASSDNVIGIRVTGVHAKVLSSNTYINGFGFANVTGFFISDGSDIIIGPSEIENTSYGIQIPNIGAGPNIKFVDVTFNEIGILDLDIENPATTGIVIMVAERSKVFIDPTSTVSVEYTDPVANGKTIVGSLYLGYNNEQTTDTINLIKETPAMGVINGGELTSNTGLQLAISAGYGYLTTMIDNNNVLRQVTWNDTIITLPANTTSYIYADPNGSIISNSSKPSTISNILLGRVHTDDISVDIIDATPLDTFHLNNTLDEYNRDVFGSIFANGSIVTTNGSNQLAISPGKYYFSGNIYRPIGQDYPAVFTSYYHNGSNTFDKSNQTVVDDTKYDNGVNLVPIGHIVAATININTIVGSPTITSSGLFTPALDQRLLSGTGIPNNITAAYVDANTMTLSNNALTTGTTTATFMISSTDNIAISTTASSTTITSNGLFTANFVGATIIAAGIPNGTTVASFVDTNTITISSPATATAATTATFAHFGTFVKHSLYLVGQGANEKYLLVYSQNQYDSLEAARSADLPTPPSYFNEGIVSIASIIAEGYASSLSITSERPIPGFNATSLSSTIYHSNLLGLLNDDHPQYLLVNGTRAMQDNLDLGSFSINNVGLVDNVKVSAHATRHLPNGVDSLTTAAPITNLSANSTNYVGTANSFARSDHIHAIDTDLPTTQLPGQPNSIGTSSALARADHVHNIPTDIPVDIGVINTMGTASSFARSDHVHQGLHSLKNGTGTARYGDIVLQTGPGVTIADNASGVFTIDTKGGANEFAVSNPALLTISYTAGRINNNGIITNIPAGMITVPANITNGAVYVDINGTIKSNISGIIPAGAIPLALYSSNSLQITNIQDLRTYINSSMVAGTPVIQNADQTNTEGTSNQYARADHVHNIPTAAPITTLLTTTDNNQGTAITFAKSDHTHAIATGMATTQLPDQDNAAGTSSSFSKADHVHNIPTAAPITTLSASTLNAQGAALTFARSDHSHAILTAAPSTQTPDTGNSLGTSDSLARADHQHHIPTATPVAIGSANNQGTTTSFARSDHVHQGVHSINVNGGVGRFGDLTLQQGDGIIVTDNGTGTLSIAAAVPEGPVGPKGEQGDVGATGAKGEPGVKGDKGDQGTKGDTGATGNTGQTGSKGDPGSKGDIGPYGILGTGINIGTSGVGVFADKTAGGDFEFKKIRPASSKIIVTDNTANNTVDIDAATGSTATTLAIGNDARFSAPQVLVVKNSNPGTGEFTSIKAAMDSITDSGPTRRYTIFVNTGTYLEDTIVMKPFTVIAGIEQKAVVIQPNGPNKHIIIAGRKNNIQNVSFVGNNSVGYAAIVYDGAVDGVLRILNCKFESLDIIIRQTADNGISASEIVTCFIEPSVNCTTGFIMDTTNSNGNQCITNIKNLLWNADATANPTFASLFKITGPTTNTTVKNSSLGPISGLLTGKIFDVSNGAILVSDAVTIKNFGTVIDVPTGDVAPSLYINAMNMINCTTNLNIQHPGTKGHLDGYTEYLKTHINPDAPFFITNKDQKIVTVYKKGGDFATVKDALNAITDASPTVLYTIQMGPGIFTEDNPIMMKPYVTILGYNGDSSVIQAANPDQNLIVGAAESTISYLQLTGSTASGCSAVYYEGGAGIFVVDSVIFGQNDILIEATSVAGPANIKCNACYVPYGSGASTMIKLHDNGVYPVYLLGTDITQVDAGFNEILNGLDISGPLTGALINQMTLTKFGGTGIGMNITNGGRLLISNSTLTGFDTSIKTTAAGPAPLVQLLSLSSFSATSWDIRYEHPLTNGSITGIFDRTKVSIDPAITRVSVLFSDSTNQGTSILGNVYLAKTVDNFVEITEIITKSPTMGLYLGGEITTGTDLSVNIAAGNGYLLVDNVLKQFHWDSRNLTFPANSNNYIYVNSNGIFTTSTSQPDTKSNILLGRAVTTNTSIEFIDSSNVEGINMGNNLDNFNRHALGPIYESGSIVTANNARELAVTAGIYFFSANEFRPSGKSFGFTFKVYYQNGAGGFVQTTATSVDNQFYDNGSGTLQPLSFGYYAKHSLYIIGDGADETYLFVYSQNQYVTLVEAEGAGIPVPPVYFNDAVTLIASIITQAGTSQIVEVRDERPVIGFKASGVSASAVHGNLLGLDADDHKQYILTNGTRAFTGDINAGGNNIVGVNLIKGIDIASHGSRHLPLGVDPITTAAPTTNLTAITTNAEGVQNSFARSDHLHAISTGPASQIIPDQPNATGTSANLARADHIHNIPTGIPVAISNSNAQGISSSFAKSDHVHEGIHSVKIGSSGTARFGDITLQQGNGISIIDGGSGIVSIDTNNAANELVVSAGTGLVANYTAGRIGINGTIINILAGSIVLPASLTNGTIFVDTAGVVAASIDGIYPPNSVPLANYSSDANIITSIADNRVFLNNNVIFGAATDISNITATSAATAGTTYKYAMADHIHTISTAAATSQVPDIANNTGTSAALARADHIHNIPTAAPISNLSANSSNVRGNAATFSRSDHGHAISTGAPISQTPDQINASGTSTNLVRADHVHNIPTAAPAVNLSATTINAQGNSSAFARSDHSHAISTGTPSTLTPDQSNSAGSSSNLARADHIHQIPTAAPVSIGASNSIGTAATFARSDHVHQGIHSLQVGTTGTPRYGDVILQAGSGTTVQDSGTGIFTIDTISGGNELLVSAGANLTANYTSGRTNINGTITNIAAGTIILPALTTNGTIFVSVAGTVAQSSSTTFPPNSVPLATYTTGTSTISSITDARVFFRNQILFGTASDITNITATASTSAGTTNRYAMADHVHAISTNVAVTLTPDLSNASGTSASLARADHVHAIPTAAPVTNLSATTTNTLGTATSFARSDHLHAVSTGTASTQVPDQPNAPGTSANLARADHVHNIPTAAPITSLSATTANSAGTASTFAKSDHMHAILTNAASTQTPDLTNAAGTSANLARADHIHNIPTAVPVSIGTTNTQGTASTFARSDHVHNHGNQDGGSLHSVVTTTTAGFMSSSDKSKLDGINSGVGTTWLISEQYAQGTNAGTLSSGSGNIRVLNTNSNPTNTAVTLTTSNYQITIQPGTYRVFASAPGYNCNGHQIVFQNVNNNNEIYYGSTEYAARVGGGAMSQTRSILQCQFTLTTATSYALYHRAQNTESGDGMGKAANLGREVYAMVEIQKI